MPTILRKEYPEDKYGILDVRVLLKNGEQMDLEMQVVPFEFWFQRSFYYLSKMVTDQMKTGDTYDRIKPEFWTLISLKMIPDVIMRECFVIKRLEKC